jgi:membrane fusion protein, multidrug efflux system
MPPANETDAESAKTAGPGDAKDGGKDAQESGPPKPRSKKPLIILGAVVVVAAIVAFFIWFAHRNQVSTDDAYTDGNVITMAPKVSGYVVELLINDNSRVRRGDLLLRIEPQDFRTAQAAAQSQLALAKAQLKTAETALRIAHVQFPAQLVSAEAQRQSAAAVLAQAQASYARQHEVDRRATTQENIDTATSQQLSSNANLKSAQAQVAIAGLVPEQIQQAMNAVSEKTAQVQQAESQLEQANLNLSYTEIRSPSDGFITLRSVQRGTYLTAGQTMFLIVTPDVWVTANFKESQIGRMLPGDAVDLEVDAYSGFKLHGHVQSIQYGSGSRFSAFPAENATGNFVKIVQRVPVKIAIDRGLDPNRPLPLGLSVSPVVHFP